MRATTEHSPILMSPNLPKDQHEWGGGASHQATPETTTGQGTVERVPVMMMPENFSQMMMPMAKLANSPIFTGRDVSEFVE